LYWKRRAAPTTAALSKSQNPAASRSKRLWKHSESRKA